MCEVTVSFRFVTELMYGVEVYDILVDGRLDENTYNQLRNNFPGLDVSIVNYRDEKPICIVYAIDSYKRSSETDDLLYFNAGDVDDLLIEWWDRQIDEFLENTDYQSAKPNWICYTDFV